MSRIEKRRIIGAKRNGKWEDANPDMEVWTTKGTLRNMADLGYTHVRLADVSPRLAFSITELLEGNNA